MKIKRALAILGIFLSLFTMLYVSAEEITYQNVITDDTTIEEDFEILGMEIEDYYIPESYDYDKWYVIAMSEAYIDKEIQTYFYLYNPAGLVVIPPLRINYSISEGEVLKTDLTILEYDAEHGYLKANGFKYSYRESCTIGISSILSEYEEDDPINSGEVIKTYREDSSDFKASLTHSLLNESFGIELNFNSTLVIDEFFPCRIEIVPDNSFSSIWLDFWDITEKNLYLHFYNFNFPDHIQPDSIEYAKFEYDYCHYRDDYIVQPNMTVKHERQEISREHLIKEYLPGTKTFKSNNASQELAFQVFVLGNRIEKGEFGYIEEFTAEQKKAFDYDCSILLDSTIQTQDFKVTAQTDHNFELENIQMIELHYKKNGILYKCQVVVPPADEEDLGKPEAEKNWLQKLLIMIADFILNCLQISVKIVPDWGKYIIGAVPLILGFFVVLFLLPYLILFIPRVGEKIKEILILIGTGIKEFFIILGTGIWFVVCLPVNLIKLIFRKKE